mmetsp:Transcript_80619/g.246371  ORF Transcript_80619/g.246371 Transcript_80619/m.246371 type:complete len:350 (-) Transcript_80619:937-1986(-)
MAFLSNKFTQPLWLYGVPFFLVFNLPSSRKNKSASWPSSLSASTNSMANRLLAAQTGDTLSLGVLLFNVFHVSSPWPSFSVHPYGLSSNSHAVAPDRPKWGAAALHSSSVRIGIEPAGHATDPRVPVLAGRACSGVLLNLSTCSLYPGWASRLGVPGPAIRQPLEGTPYPAWNTRWLIMWTSSRPACACACSPCVPTCTHALHVRLAAETQPPPPSAAPRHSPLTHVSTALACCLNLSCDSPATVLKSRDSSPQPTVTCEPAAKSSGRGTFARDAFAWASSAFRYTHREHVPVRTPMAMVSTSQLSSCCSNRHWASAPEPGNESARRRFRWTQQASGSAMRHTGSLATP